MNHDNSAKKKKKRIILVIIITLLVIGAFYFGKSVATKTNFRDDKTPQDQKNPLKQPPNDKTPSPSSIPNSNFSSKTLANALKVDLKDALTNESRWSSGYFNDYLVYDKSRDIWRHGINENKNLTRELLQIAKSLLVFNLFKIIL